MKLRYYQQEALENGMSCLQVANALIVMPTGSGKTVVFASMIREYLNRGKRVLVLCHKEELIRQAWDKIKEVAGTEAGIEKAETRSNGEPVVIASVPTLQNARLESFPPDYFGLVIVDECHHMRAKTWEKILEYFRCPTAGFTATPNRHDGKNLGKYFPEVSYQYPLERAIRDEVCTGIERLKPDYYLDLSSLSGIRGELPAERLESIILQVIDPICESIAAHAREHRFLGFAPGVVSAGLIAEGLRVRGIKARSISGSETDGRPLQKDERSEILDDFKNGDFTHLLNCGLIGEGVDIPPITCIGILRSVRSRSLYMQMIGRGLRPYENKPVCMLMDFSPLDMDLANPFDLFADVKQPTRLIEIARRLEANAPECNYLELIEAAREIMRKGFDRVQNKHNMRVDPVVFGEYVEMGNYLKYWSPEKANAGITRGQLGTLYRAGFQWDHCETLTRGQASEIIQIMVNKCGSIQAIPKNWAATWADSKRMEYGL